MKKCLKCQKEYPDNMSFCTSCGQKLTEVQQRREIFCSNCGTKNKIEAKFCVNCGTPFAQDRSTQSAGAQTAATRSPNNGAYAQQQQAVRNFSDAVNGQNAQPQKSKAPVFIGIAALAVIIAAAVAVGVFWARKPDSDATDTIAKEATSGNKTPGAEPTEESIPSPEPVQTEAPVQQPQTESVDAYQTYYNNLDKKFKNYIITDTATAKIDTYSKMLKDAITQKDAALCKTVQQNLDKLEGQLKTNSKRKITSLQSKVTQWEGKSTSKKTKKSAAYKKVKRKAKKYVVSGNYADAQIQYLECIDRLKEAKEEAKNKKKRSSSSSSSSSSSDATYYYKPVYTDNSTYYQLSNYYLSGSDVANMGSEQVRYYINTIFAVMGYRFSKSYIQNFFNYQSWYSGGWTNNQQDIINDLNAADNVLTYNYNMLKNAR